MGLNISIKGSRRERESQNIIIKGVKIQFTCFMKSPDTRNLETYKRVLISWDAFFLLTDQFWNSPTMKIIFIPSCQSGWQTNYRRFSRQKWWSVSTKLVSTIPSGRWVKTLKNGKFQLSPMCSSTKQIEQEQTNRVSLRTCISRIRNLGFIPSRFILSLHANYVFSWF